MSSKLGLKLLAGVVALSIGSGAFAASTSADANGTLFLNVVDYTKNTSYMFDTGVLVSSFSDSTSYSHNVAGDSNYAAFQATIASGDDVFYSVVGTTNAADATGATPIGLVTAVSLPTTKAGNQALNVSNNIGNFLFNVNNAAGNPAGGSSFISAAAANPNHWNFGYETQVTGSLGGISDNAAIGTSLGFYDVATNVSSGTRSGATVTAFTHTWNLDSAGNLTFNAVPLPAPLILLLSGLGLMGVVGRRGRQTEGGLTAA